MHVRDATAGAAALLALTAARGASAQPPEVEPPPPPPVGATGGVPELGVGFGWVDASGALTTEVPPRRRAPGMGGAIELDAGWRVLPSLAVGVWGAGAQLGQTPASPASADAYEAAAGFAGTWHFRPDATDVDPWLSLGSGWRGQWLGYLAGGTTARHGIELLRARVGLDVRVSPSVALAPVAGASLSTFLTEETRDGPWHAIPRPGLDTLVIVGVRATVDVPLGR